MTFTQFALSLIVFSLFLSLFSPHPSPHFFVSFALFLSLWAFPLSHSFPPLPSLLPYLIALLRFTFFALSLSLSFLLFAPRLILLYLSFSASLCSIEENATACRGVTSWMRRQTLFDVVLMQICCLVFMWYILNLHIVSSIKCSIFVILALNFRRYYLFSCLFVGWWRVI